MAATDGALIASMAANSIVVVTAVAALGRVAWKRFRALVLRDVSTPLSELKSTVDTLTKSVSTVNKRLDDHLRDHGANRTMIGGRKHG